MNANSEAAKNTAGHESQHMKSEATHAAKDVGGTAKHEAKAVTEEAKGQVKSLAASLSDEIEVQASTQQSRLAEQSRTVSEDLQRVARGERPESDMVNQLISQAADQAQRITERLENSEPRDILRDVRRFASRRPGMFLAIAAGLGVAAGRLTRGFTDSDDSPSAGGSRISGTGAGVYGYDRTPGVESRYEPTSDYGGESARIVDPTRAGTPGAATHGSRMEPTSDYGGEPRPAVTDEGIDVRGKGMNESGRYA